MKTVTLIISLVLLISFIGYVALSRGNGTALASATQTSAEAKHSCDTEAAHPADPQRFATGKANDEIVPVLGVRACSEAVTQFPNEPRFQFQLGRALLAMKRTGEAEKAFLTASASGFKAANYYLAELKLRSYWTAESDEALDEIKHLLEESAESFPPAAERLGEITFDKNAFTSPKLVEALYDEDYERLNQCRLVVAIYFRGIHDFLATEFNPEDNDCPAYVVDPSISFDLDQAVAGDPRSTIEGAGYALAISSAALAGSLIFDPTWRGDRQKWFDFYHGLGRRDGQFLAHHHGCSSPVTARLYRNIVQFSKVKSPLSEYGSRMLKGGGMDLFRKPSEAVAERSDGRF